jgi:RNA recognition motif-containing protein
MSNKMYVGNLPFSASETELRSMFSVFGTVTEVALVLDRETSRPRGFGFVSMDSRESMEKAVKEMDGRELEGRKINVNEARERESRGGPGSGLRNGGGGDGNGGGRRW